MGVSMPCSGSSDFIPCTRGAVIIRNKIKQECVTLEYNEIKLFCSIKELAGQEVMSIMEFKYCPFCGDYIGGKYEHSV